MQTYSEPIEVEVNLRLTVSRPVCLVPGSHLCPMTTFLLSRTIASSLIRGTLSDERMGL
jgi:hypothetical protein